MRATAKVVRKDNRKLLDCTIEGRYGSWRYPCRSIVLYKLQLVPFPDYKLVASFEASMFEDNAEIEFFRIDNFDVEQLFRDEYILYLYL